MNPPEGPAGGTPYYLDALSPGPRLSGFAPSPASGGGDRGGIAGVYRGPAGGFRDDREISRGHL